MSVDAVTKIFLGGPASGKTFSFETANVLSNIGPVKMRDACYCHAMIVPVPVNQYAIIYIHMDPVDAIKKSLLGHAEDLAKSIARSGDIAVGLCRFLDDSTIYYLSRDIRDSIGLAG